MLWLFRYIKGYLQIELSGEYAEQLINKTIKNGILLWGLKYRKNSIVGYIQAADFKYLLALRRKARARVKIIKKTGFPFIARRYRKRIGFLLGAAIFLSLLEILSLFIWTVEVSGNNTVKSEDVIAACKKIGVYEGVRKSEVNSKNMADRLLIEMPSLAWCSFNIEGCLVTVNVTEVKNLRDENSDMPSNLIANEDGIIKKIDVTSGNPLVRVGDVVARGDVLVSGINESMSSTVFLRSKGTVTAEIQKTFTAKGEFVKAVEEPTGKVKRRSVLKAFGINIPLYFTSVKGSFISEKSNKRLVIADKKLPFSLTTKSYYFTEKTKINYSAAQLKQILKKDVEKQIEAYGDEKYVIQEEKYITSETGAELEWTVIITCDIATEKKITVKNE